MKQYPLFTALAISLLLFLSCFNHNDDPELIIEIYIQGTVKDAATGKPITDAEVTLSFEEKTLQKSKTNSKGAFSFPVSQDGNYQLFVQATGYRNAEKSFPLTNLSNNDVDITMTLANSLTITNESSYDIENVKWSNGNANFGSIKIAGSVEVPVDTGSGYVFFTRSNDGLNVHTEYVAVKQGERRKYIVADTTIVVEVGYGENKKTLGAIKTANPSSSSVAPSSSSAVVTLPSSNSVPSSNSNGEIEPSSSSVALSSNSVPITYTLACANIPATFVAEGTVITAPAVTCNGNAGSTSVTSGLSWTSAPIWNNPDGGIYTGISVTASSGNCSGKTATCNGTITVQAGFILGEPVEYEDEIYETIKIGSQTWFKRNLNYAAEGSGCHKNNPANCATYGRLYDWATAMKLPRCNDRSCAEQVKAKHQGICPNGWHIPSDVEWTTLINFVGTDLAKKLRASGTDIYGFSALSGGYGDYSGVGYDYWWSATEKDNTYAYQYGIYSDASSSIYYFYKADLYSVRCLKD
jgi:uncharacterized protein (TIGR02145 family)